MSDQISFLSSLSLIFQVKKALLSRWKCEWWSHSFESGTQETTRSWMKTRIWAFGSCEIHYTTFQWGTHANFNLHTSLLISKSLSSEAFVGFHFWRGAKDLPRFRTGIFESEAGDKFPLLMARRLPSYILRGVLFSTQAPTVFRHLTLKFKN